jgi:hypothetical protein
MRRAGTAAQDHPTPLALSLLGIGNNCAEIFSGRLLLN